jgi:hypothetical protein
MPPLSHRGVRDDFPQTHLVHPVRAATLLKSGLTPQTHGRDRTALALSIAGAVLGV